MLGKVLKQDMRTSAKMFFPLYVMILAVTVLAITTYFISQKINSPIMSFASGTTVVLYVLAILAAGILPGVFIIMYFYRCFLTDEAYLNCTLPVKTSTQVISKQINGVIWLLLSAVVSVTALLMLLGGIIGEDWREIMAIVSEAWTEMYEEIQDILGSIWTRESGILTAISVVVSVVFSFSRIYAAMAVGQAFFKNKIAGSILAYLGLNMILNMVSQGVSFATIYTDSVNPYLIFGILLQIAEGIGCLLLTTYFLKNKLNLE